LPTVDPQAYDDQVRQVVHLTTDKPGDELEGVTLQGDRQRFVAFGPRSGGAPVVELRRLFAGQGRVRFGGTPSRIYVDVDRLTPDSLAEDRPLVALDMIARSDAAGLERAILSALPYVDEIVVGIDDRSDTETRLVAEAYADQVHTFGAAELGIPAEQWAGNRFDFAAARNLGRAKLRAPWALVLDTDEYIRHALDWRPALRAAGDDVAAFDLVVYDRGSRHRNNQRLARSSFRWWSAAHNQLATTGRIIADGMVCEIVHDTSTRSPEERARRSAQRSQNIEQLRDAAAAGEINALYHLALHLLGEGKDEGAELAEDYRKRLEVEGPGRDHRAHLAMAAACMYYNRDDLDRADMWATRALLDGPRPEALCLKGDICEDRGDLQTALWWYECACVVEDFGLFKWQHITALKRGRRGGLRRALGLPQAA
jgi:hypothetical protein